MIIAYAKSALVALFLLLGLGAVAQAALKQVPLAIIKADGSRLTLTVEVAESSAERQQGLMYRKTMPENHGMIFDFGMSRIVTMWMKNTDIALDMIFADRKGTIVSLAENTVPESQALISSGSPVSFAIEVNAGFLSRNGIKVGDRVDTVAISNSPSP